ncbi:Uma2 family endonuclease [Sphaerospermopsis sp. LEGE 00249]|uniref:Uma2 family endonuclease n=1 Tax=Sphaerospermopsis sp. LEGE 00249 TaxID=1380707 RepID=UPI00164D733D|nr:Uma2 family endonuclease [Sphaerospermopsis sp. LEGE 00249]MBC5798209.1 Uma2 family endonuclease [Sphaerospermopsis sp. LEGE 00249]
MTLAKPADIDITHLPDHTELPESDGTFVLAKRTVGQNFQEHPQSILLTDSINSTLQKIHPDGQYAIGQDCGIYWRLTEPLEKGAEAPDWFYVANVPPMLNGKFRRSYVLWQEYIAPLIVLEFVSGDGAEERDKTPFNGKFWVYEQAIRVPFYGIYEVQKASVKVYHLVNGRYELLPANERGHYPILPLGVELGIWEGMYNNMQAPWLRWWDLQGNLLLHSGEKTQQLTSQLEQEQQKAARLAERLRELGVNPYEV